MIDFSNDKKREEKMNDLLCRDLEEKNFYLGFFEKIISFLISLT